MIRFDFILIAPFIFMFRYLFLKKISDVIVGILIFCVGLYISIVAGLLVPEKILAVYDLAREEIILRSSEPGWDLRTKIFVATTVLSPIGWGVLIAAIFWCFKTKVAWKPLALGVICLMPMLFSARNILTPKYMIPAFAVAPVLVVMLWSRVVTLWSAKFRDWLSLCLVIMTIGLLIFSIEPTNAPPFLKVSVTDNRQIGTHDGARSWGSYFWQFRRVAATKSKEDELADELLKYFEKPGSLNVVLVGDENFFSSGGVAWRQLQLQLERKGFSGRVVEAGRIEFKVPSGTVTLSTGHKIETAACIVWLDEINAELETPAAWIKLNCDSG